MSIIMRKDRPKMWEIWVNWKKTGKMPKEIYQKKQLNKLKKIKKPSENLTPSQFKILRSMNGGLKREEITRIQIARATGLCVNTVSTNLKLMDKRGLIVLKKDFVNNTNAFILKAIIKDKGYKLLQEWKKEYSN